MRHLPREGRNIWKRLSSKTAGILALTVLLVMCGLTPAQVLAQGRGQSPAAPPPATKSPATPSTAVQPTAVPQWQTDAGGKLAFDVASVKQDTATPSAQTVTSNIPLGPQDLFTPTGGLLSATNFPLLQYMVFAFKLTPNQVQDVMSQLPKWANDDRYDIQARATGNPTKDQYRLMMQALLADRFKMVIHFETRQLPVMALVLDKPGKLGPQIQPHPGDSPCSTAPPGPNAAPGPPPTVAGGFPEPCGALEGCKQAYPAASVPAREICP